MIQYFSHFTLHKSIKVNSTSPSSSTERQARTVQYFDNFINFFLAVESRQYTESRLDTIDRV